jgi:AcrR family transcriptional regulator
MAIETPIETSIETDDAQLVALTPERRRAMTRRHLLEAAAMVFARQGFHGATLDEVAATAGFTKGAVYSNFKSKDDLFLALLADRTERQLAVVSDVLAAGGHAAAEQFPLVSQLFRGELFWDDDFATLYLEFVLYARRHPDAQTKLAETALRTRAMVQELIEAEYAALGIAPKYGSADIAAMSLALFGGFGLDRLIDPRSVSSETLDTTLTLLFEALVHPQ